MSSDAVGVVGSLVGVVLGFALGEGSRWWQERRGRQEGRRAIESELAANLAMVPSRRQTLVKMRAAVLEQQVLPGRGVRFLTLAHQQFAASCLREFTPVERDSLHVIQEYFGTVDSFMSDYDERLAQAVERKLMADPFAVFRGFIEDHLRALDTLERLIPSFLAGKAIDVFHRSGAPNQPIAQS